MLAWSADPRESSLSTDQSNKKQAWDFFRDLHEALNDAAPPAAEGAEMLRSVVEAARSEPDRGAWRFPEGAYINTLVVPQISDFLRGNGLTEAQARDSLLSESFRAWPKRCSQSPGRAGKYPFDKGLGNSSAKVLERWVADRPGRPLGGQFPDLALKSPSPHTALFEAKLFRKGRLRSAQTALVNDFYQAFFYLGLTRLPATPTHPEWNYDYAVLVAYDVTPDAALMQAWDSFDPAIKRSLWDDANIYPMIYDGTRVC